MSSKYKVYMITNIVNNKSYIGLTGRDMSVRWKAHVYNANSTKHYNSHFMRAIKKYGKESFQTKILIDGVASKEEACSLEKETIEKYDTYNNGYNSTLGGEGTSGYVLTKADREKLSKNLKAACAARGPINIKRLSQSYTEGNRKRYNTKKHWFYHAEHGTDFMYATELAEKYNIPKYGIIKLTAGRNKSSRGWTLVKPSTKNDVVKS